MKTNLSKYILLLSGVTLGLVFYFSNPMTVSADGTPYGEWSGSNSASAGSLQIVPTGYGLTAIGYGSDDHRCTLIIKTAPVNLNTDGQPVVDFGAVTGWQASDCGAGDGDDDFETGRGYGPRVEPISDHYATGWTWGASTDGGLLNNDDFSGNECYYQEYAPLTNIDNRTGWGAAYDGTCNNNGYQRVDLKWVWGAPAGQVIVAVGLSLANDADVSMVGMDTRHAPPTADLSANGSENITVNVGDNIDYVWSSTNGSSASSNYIVTLGSCSPSSGPGVPNDPGVANDLGGSASVTVDSSQAGCTYEITYTVTGFAGTASDTITVTVNSVVFPPVVCSPDSSSTAINTDVTLTAFGGTGTYSWLAPSGTPSSDSGSSFTVRYSSSGPKTVTVTSGLSDTCTVNVSAPSAPTANAGPTHPLTVSTSHTHSGASASDSDGNLASYAWVISNCPSVCPSLSGASGVISGSSASISGPTYTPTAAGNHTLTLTVTDSGGLTGTSSVIEGVCPAVSISGINGQKPPDPEHSGVNTDDTYLIIYGSFSDSGNTVRVDGVPRSPDFQSAAKINVPISLSAGPHTVEVTNQCDNSSGSVSFSVVSVAAPTAPTATLQVRANGTSTWGSSVTVTAPQAVDYQWQSTDAVSATSWYCLNNSTCNEPGDAGWVANSPSNDQLLNQSTAGLSSGMYTIRYMVTSSDGQTATARITVTVNTEPVGGGDVSVTCVSEATTDQSVTLSASGGDGSYSWTVSPTSGATLSSTSGASITATFSDTGLYTVTVTSGGQSASCEITVQPTATGDFSIISIPPSRQIVKGESTSFTIQITRYDPFTGSVGLALSGCPANTTCYHSPQTIPSGQTVSSLIVQTTAFTSAGTYTLTTTGVGTSGNHSTNSQLVVTDGPTIALSCTNNCEFVGEEGGPPPPNQTLTITNSGTGTLNWGASRYPYWLALSSASGSTVAGGAPSSITLSVNTAAIPAGIYKPSIRVGSGNASNDPQFQTVILKLSGEPNAVINCNDQPAPPDCTIYRGESIELLNNSTP